ncbi:taste receptor type 2 member 134-like [Trichosurus vulpecula]|uniref:taste receptor type 2 member 134-like n=1 Tax=Trichosurus vulpecula TaxID=9337 RepID=UPI00186AFB3A|nr:taste receptor type 2 member 134-like [Trichosurus vulpecula]
MPSLLILFFMIFFLLESMAGIIENGFIIIVLAREWVRCWSLPSGDMILVSLGISRFFLHWAAVLSSFYTYFYPTNTSLYLFTFWSFTNMTTFWFTTWLAVFYCVKISAFTQPIFLWLKWRISQFVPWLLLWSLLISILICISSFAKGQYIFQLALAGNYTEKTTWDDMTHALQNHFFLLLQIFILLISFFFFLVSTILVISSLCRHLRDMQRYGAGPQDPSMQVHITALKSLFFFLIIYASYVMPVVVTTIVETSVWSFDFWVWQVVAYAGTSIHSAFLIQNSSKLRRALKKMLYDPEAA